MCSVRSRLKASPAIRTRSARAARLRSSTVCGLTGTVDRWSVLRWCLPVGRRPGVTRRGKGEGCGDVLVDQECVTLKNERLVHEAPAAYKDIGDVVAVQAEAGIAAPVARMRPLLTFKG